MSHDSHISSFRPGHVSAAKSFQLQLQPKMFNLLTCAQPPFSRSPCDQREDPAATTALPSPTH